MTRDEMDETERWIREVLAALQAEYAKAAKPYIDKLVMLRSMRVPEIVISADQYAALTASKGALPGEKP